MTRSRYNQPGILSLPGELITYTASLLDRKSAAALASCHSSLQQAGEATLWRSLRVTDKECRPIVHLKQPWELWRVDVTDSTSVAPYFRLNGNTNEIFEQFLQNLTANSWRVKMVRSLEIDLRYGLPKNLLKILGEVGQNLERLVLKTPGPVHHAAYSLNTMVELFRSMPGLFSALQEMRIDVRYRWSETVVTIARAAPNLRVLHVRSHPHRISGGPRYRHDPVTLPHLEELIVDEMEDAFVPVLSQITASATGLQRVALRDHTHKWRPATDNALIEILGECESLRWLECSSAVNSHLSEPDRFVNVERLAVLWGTDLVMNTPGHVSSSSLISLLI